MVGGIFEAIKGAASAILRRPRAIAAAFVLYAALIGAVYLFATTREATVGELLLTFLLIVLAAVLFFMLQAIGIRYARGEDERLMRMVGRALVDSWKLFVVSLPVAVLVVLVLLALGAIGSRVTGFFGYLIAGLEALTLYLAAPLLAIKLWVAASRGGVTQAFRQLGRHFVKAFALRPLVIYILTGLIFGAAAWLLIFTRTQFGGVWGDIWLLAARLAMAGVVIFFGWMLTLGALARTHEGGYKKEG